MFHIFSNSFSKNLNDSKNFLPIIDKSIFDLNLSVVKENISQILINGENIIGNEKSEKNPFLNLKNTIIVSNHKYILIDPVVFLIMSSYSDNINSIIRSVIGDNLMPTNKAFNFFYYYTVILLGFGFRINSKNISDLLLNMGAIKKKRKITIENNSQYNNDLSSILKNNQNIWISGTNGRTKRPIIDIYRNLERLNDIHSFNIIPVNLKYKSEIYTNNKLKNLKLSKMILDIIDMLKEINHKNISLDLKIGKQKPFEKYERQEIEDIIFDK